MQRIVTGDNELHEAVRHCLSFHDFRSRISNLSLAKKIQYSLATNNAGELPIDVNNESLSSSDKHKIFFQLLHFARMKKNKDLHEPVSFQEILEMYHPDPNSELYHNLKNACEIVNKIREHSSSRISLTHPSNITRSDENHKLHFKHDAEWKSEYYLCNDIILNEAKFEYVNVNNPYSIVITFSEETRKHLYEIERQFYESEINNCYEMARFACHIGMEMKIPVSAYEYDDDYGDHAFNAIVDRDASCDKIDDEFSLKNTVIFDAWAGLVCRGMEYKTKLEDHKLIFHNDQSYHLITKFNPNYNRISKSNILSMNDSKTYQYEFTNDLLKELILLSIDTLSAKEIFLFLEVIQKNMQMCIDNELISVDEIRSWSNPLKMLRHYFSSDYQYLPLISYLYCGDQDLYKKKICEALDNSVNLNQSDTDGMTTLHHAVLQKNVDIIEIFIKHGANVNTYLQSSGETPLITAVQLNDIRIVKMLLNAGADPNCQSGAALFTAAVENYSEIVDILLKHHDIKIQPLVLTIKTSREIVKKECKEIRMYMNDHIIQHMNGNSSHISITPCEIAMIMGNITIAKKLQCFENKKNQNINVEKTSQLGVFNNKNSMPIHSYTDDMPDCRCTIF